LSNCAGKIRERFYCNLSHAYLLFFEKKYPAEREFFSHIFIVRLSKIPDRIYKGRHLQKGSRDPVSSQLTKKSRDARMLDSGHYKMKKVGKVAAGM
jgi:hypothetical protein